MQQAGQRTKLFASAFGITIAAAAACGGSSGDAPSQPEVEGGGGDGALADASDGGAGEAAATSQTAFTSTGKSPEPCSLPAAACSDWPDPSTEGVVTKYTSTEKFGGAILARTFHVYVPNVVASDTAPAPLVVLLHGGTQSGTRFLVTQTWTTLARAPAAGVSWRPNVSLCKALPTTAENGLAYKTAAGATCAPPLKTATSTKPFIAVYPDGVVDPGTTDARHWEDGRVPSPGFDSPGPNRDDVGFIDHVIAVLLAEKGLHVDPARIYVTGVSNGGMMTQRLAAEMANPQVPNLRRVAAFAAFVSDLAEPLKPTLLKGATVPFGMALYHGTDIDMPDCNTPGCTTPTVIGDGRMPFGVAGGVYFVNSPDRGRVISGPDTITSWRAALGAAAGTAPTTNIADVGFFSKHETTTYGTSPVVFESWVTTGGGHGLLSTREDFLPVVRGWAFLSSFERATGGVLTRQSPSWVTGDF